MSNTTEISDLLKRDGVIAEEQEETSSVRPYTMRKLSSKDISPMLKVLRKLNFKKIKEALSDVDFEKLMEATQEINSNVDEEENNDEKLVVINPYADTEDDTENINSDLANAKKASLMNIGKDLVFEILPIVLEAIDDALPEVNKLLASVINWNVEDVENMELDLYFTLIFDFIHKEEFVDFMRVASKFMK